MLHGTIDLHLHSTCSDGRDTPESLVAMAVENNYQTISITDHDTVAGVVRATKAAQGTPLEVIPGIELSSIDNSVDIHILGYYFDYTNPDFLKKITFFKEKRRERGEEIVNCLNRLGLDISIETVLKIAHGAPVGRPHIAEALLSENLINTFNEAFSLYIGTNGPAFVPKYNITPREAIELILNNNGIPVLAHPVVYHRDELIYKLVEYGLMGIEAIHPLHVPEKQYHYRNLAKQHRLIVTGGSDWHGRSRIQNFHNFMYSGEILEKSVRHMKLIINSRKTGSERIIASET